MALNVCLPGQILSFIDRSGKNPKQVHTKLVHHLPETNLFLFLWRKMDWRHALSPPPASQAAPRAGWRTAALAAVHSRARDRCARCTIPQSQQGSSRESSTWAPSPLQSSTQRTRALRRPCTTSVVSQKRPKRFETTGVSVAAMFPFGHLRQRRVFPRCLHRNYSHITYEHCVCVCV